MSFFNITVCQSCRRGRELTPLASHWWRTPRLIRRQGCRQCRRSPHLMLGSIRITTPPMGSQGISSPIPRSTQEIGTFSLCYLLCSLFPSSVKPAHGARRTAYGHSGYGYCVLCTTLIARVPRGIKWTSSQGLLWSCMAVRLITHAYISGKSQTHYQEPRRRIGVVRSAGLPISKGSWINSHYFVGLRSSQPATGASRAAV